MLKKKNRLNLSYPKNSNILERGQANFKPGRYFFIYSRENEQHLKLAVIVPKKTIAKAVDRNFYRRRLYLMIEEILQEKNADFLKLKKDLVVLLRKNIKLKDSKEENLADFKKELKRKLSI